MTNTQISIPDLTDFDRRFAQNEKNLARENASEEAKRLRAAWEEARMSEFLAQADPNDPNAIEYARQSATSAVENLVLIGEYVIHVVEGGKTVPVKVKDILAEPSRYHEKRCLDPLEPEYDGGRAVGILYTCQSCPKLFSHAHGGASYKMRRNRHRIQLVAGGDSVAVKEIIGHLANDPMVFLFNNGLATVRDGIIHPFNEYTLKHFLGDRVQLWVRKKAGEIDINFSDAILKEVLANASIYPIRPLDAVVTAPTLRLDGSVVDQPGYDEATRLFLAMPADAEHTIPLEPSISEVRDAFEALWFPFSSFPFADNMAKGAFLAALVTATIRGILPTSPAFGLDAPTQGSGKSLAARCLAALATGKAPLEMPPARGRDDEEYRKRLLPIILAGWRAFVLDNVVGEFDSPSMAMFLTSPEYGDRELGHSKFSGAVNRTLVLITGNNLRCTGDLARRVISCRIDPGTERPMTREFDLDPFTYVIAHRQNLVAAALTIIRGRFSHMQTAAPGKLASFEDWDNLARQSVIWLSTDVFPGEFGDPITLVLEAQDNDPTVELETDLFKALAKVFGESEFTAANCYANTSSLCISELSFAFQEMAGEKATHSARSIGKVLGYRVGRVRDGMKLVARKASSKEALKYRVVKVDDC